MKQIIRSDKAPQAIGTYSQAVKAGNTVYLSGQIGMDPQTMELVEGGVKAQAEQMFENIAHVANAAGGNLNAVIKLTIYLTDMDNFQFVNQVMEKYWQTTYPARACVAVKALPKSAEVEADAIMILGEE